MPAHRPRRAAKPTLRDRIGLSSVGLDVSAIEWVMVVCLVLMLPALVTFIPR